MLRLIISSVVTLLMACAPITAAPVVVTDIPPLHSLVANVMGDLGTPILLIDGASDAHHLQLRPSQARALAKAEIVFWVGPELTPWLEKGLGTLAQEAQTVSLLHFSGSHIRSHLGAPGSIDPHAWLDPQNALNWLSLIADTLSNADPVNRTIYFQNAERTAQEILELQNMTNQSLERFAGKKLAFSHDAFGYFTNRFNLQTIGVLSQGDAVKPGAAHLRKMSKLFQTNDVACLFIEPGHDSDFAKGFAKKYDVPTAVLDPLGTILKPGKSLYRELIQNIVSGFEECILPD